MTSLQISFLVMFIVIIVVMFFLWFFVNKYIINKRLDIYEKNFEKINTNISSLNEDIKSLNKDLITETNALKCFVKNGGKALIATMKNFSYCNLVLQYLDGFKLKEHFFYNIIELTEETKNLCVAQILEETNSIIVVKICVEANIDEEKNLYKIFEIDKKTNERHDITRYYIKEENNEKQ